MNYLAIGFWLLFLSAASPLWGQQTPQWLNYTTDASIRPIALEGDDVWVPMQGGLLKINRQSQRREVFLPCNSGIKTSAVNEVLVDTGGVKWIASERGGLFRFDGQHWQQFYYINTGDTLIETRNLIKDTLGRIWFLSTINSGNNLYAKLFYYDGQKFVRVPNYIYQGKIVSYKALVADLYGNVWVIAGSALFKIAPDGTMTQYDASNSPWTLEETLVGLGYNAVRDILYMSTSKYMPGGPTQYGLWQFAQGKWTSKPPAEAFKRISSMQYDPDGYFWTFYDNSSKVRKFDDENWEDLTLADLGLSGNNYSYLIIDTAGHFWGFFPFENEILRERLADGTWKSYYTDLYPFSTNYWDLAKTDHRGWVWLSGSGYLWAYDGLKWHDYTAQIVASLPFTTTSNRIGISGIEVDPSNGDIMLGCETGLASTSGFVIFDGKTFKFHQAKGTTNTYGVLPTGHSRYWVASTEGLAHYDGVQWKLYNTGNSLLEYNTVVALAADSQGNIWAQDYYSKLYTINPNGQWRKFDIPVESWGRIYCDRQGKIWVGGKGGPIFFDGTDWNSVTVPSDSFKAHLIAVAQDLDNSYWFKTRGKLYHWDGQQTWDGYDIFNAPLTDAFIGAIQVDNWGNKWFLQSRGITVHNAKGIANPWFAPNAIATGTVFFDTDRDGLYNTLLEPGLPSQRVLIEPDSVFALSDVQGQYQFSPSLGPHEVSYPSSGTHSQTSVPLAYPFHFIDSSLWDLNFGVWTRDLPDSVGLLMVLGRARCNTSSTTMLQVQNKGYPAVDGTLLLELDSLFSVESSDPAPVDIQGNTLMWKFEGLSRWRTFQVSLVLKNPSADQAGAKARFEATLSTKALGGKEKTLQYSQTITVRCAYDPNDKIVQPVGEHVEEKSLRENPLDYTIRFQNTGNDTAFSVVISDTLSPHLNPESLEVLASSHPVRTQMNAQGVFTFVFAPLQLPWQQVDDLGSQGFVTYRIRPRTSVPSETIIENQADIYFDFNPPIATNVTRTVLVESFGTVPANTPLQPPSLWRLLPNPSNGLITAQFLGSQKTAISRIALFDLSGRLIAEHLVIDGAMEVRLDLAHLPPGLYMAKAYSAEQALPPILLTLVR